MTEITKCRICGSTNLDEIMDIGNLALTGIFPKNAEFDPPRASLKLVRCTDGCGLVQLAETYDLGAMYGETPGAPLAEDAPLKAFSVYGVDKYAAELYAELRSRVS